MGKQIYFVYGSINNELKKKRFMCTTILENKIVTVSYKFPKAKQKY